MQIKELDSKVEAARQRIIAKSDVEITVRNLDKKYSALKNIFSNSEKYSLLVAELKARKPSTLELTNVELKLGSISINGTAANYVSIAEYINSLLNKKFVGGTKGLEEVFTSVSLNSVNMENSKNSIAFFIVVDFDPSKLK
jgi:Tfp pilus assembly protein PilN